MNRYYKFLGGLLALFVLIFFLSGVLFKSMIGMELTTQVVTYGFLGLFAMAFILDFIPQYFSPYVLLISALLFGLDPFASCLIAIIASTAASILAFKIGGKASGGFFDKVVKDKMQKSKNHNNHHLTSRIINGWGRWIVLATALTPLPYFPMLFGALRMKKDNFYLFGVLPRIIGFIVITLVTTLAF